MKSNIDINKYCYEIEDFKEQLKLFCTNENISRDVLNQWCDIVYDNYYIFEGKDHDGIFEILNSLAIVEINELVVQHTESIIAYNEDADMNTDQGCCAVFVAYSTSADE